MKNIDLMRDLESRTFNYLIYILFRFKGLCASADLSVKKIQFLRAELNFFLIIVQFEPFQ